MSMAYNQVPAVLTRMNHLAGWYTHRVLSMFTMQDMCITKSQSSMHTLLIYVSISIVDTTGNEIQQICVAIQTDTFCPRIGSDLQMAWLSSGKAQHQRYWIPLWCGRISSLFYKFAYRKTEVATRDGAGSKPSSS